MGLKYDFWEKVVNCDHEWSPEYDGNGGICWTPECGWAAEEHCLKCGVYRITCSCGFCDGDSGWSYYRWKNHLAKRRLSHE
jgi:hypothetical protein